MAENRRPVVVHCASLETRKHPVKQQVYILDVTWSDGQKSQTEVNSFSLANWRSRFVIQCYKDRTDVVVPELTVKHFEINILSKKDEKRKKAVDEFFQRILELPDVQKKYQLINELLQCRSKTPPVEQDDVTEASLLYADLDFAESQAARQDTSTTGEQIAKRRRPRSAVVYTEVVPNAMHKSAFPPHPVAASSTENPKRKSLPEDDPMYLEVILAGKNSLKSSNDVSGPETVRPKAAGGNPSTNYTITEVQLRAAAAASSDSETSSAISKQPRPKQAAVYTEVKPLKIRNKPAEATPVNCADQQPPQPSSSMNNHANPTHNSNTNIRPSIPTYENIQLQETTNQGTPKEQQQFYMVTKSYEPCTKSSQELAVKAGDVIRKKCESDNSIFAVLCAKTSSAAVKTVKEGWLPIHILTPCSPEVINDSSRAVPVVRLDNECSGRCAGTTESPAGTKDTAPDAHVIDSSDNHDDTMELVSLSLPSMPQCTSPTLRTAPQLPNQLNETGVTQKGGRFGRLMKPKPAAKPRRPKDGVAGDHNEAATATVPGTIRVVAVADWPGMTGAMAFANGDSGELVYSSDRGWLCIHMREHTGWVPADYWRIVTDDGRIGGLTTNDAAPWMVGKLNRADCERLMLKSGRQRDFVVRSSPHLAGQYALSVRHEDRIHHFPIVPTEGGKFLIGKHHFSSMHNVVLYYSKNILFSDDNKLPVMLGRPFNINTGS